MYFKIFRKLIICTISTVFFTFYFSPDANAQISVTEQELISTGATAGQLGNAHDDLINSLIISGGANRLGGTANNNAGAGVSFGSFAMGRLRSTNHRGYRAPLAGKTSSFKATEWSAFGAATFSMSGPQVGSRMILSPYIGWTELDVNTDFNTGSATNKSFLYGMSAIYAIDSSYAALSVTGATGQTDSVARGAFGIGSASYNTQGVVISALLGHSVPVVSFGNGQVFAAFQGGVRHVNFGTDKYVGTALPHTIQNYLSSTTGLFSAEFYTSIPQGNLKLRPFIKNTLQVDLRYANKSTSLAPTFTTVVGREALLNKTEIGLNITGNMVNFSAAAFGEFAHDHTTFGGRLGATFKLN